MKLRDLTEQEAAKMSDDPDARYIKKTYGEGSNSLWYELNNKYLEIYVTTDSSCWVIGGAEYDKIEKE